MKQSVDVFIKLTQPLKNNGLSFNSMTWMSPNVSSGVNGLTTSIISHPHRGYLVKILQNAGQVLPINAVVLHKVSLQVFLLLKHLTTAKN